MILQATTNGAISADYTIVMSFSIIGALLLILAGLISNWLINILKDIRDSIKELYRRVSDIEESDITTNFKLDTTIKSVEDHREQWERLRIESNDIQKEILSKLQAIINNRQKD